MRVDKANTQPIQGQPRFTAPIPTPETRVQIGSDALTLGTGRIVPATPAPAAPAPAANKQAEQGGNILDDSVGRNLADGTNAAAGAADGARSIKPTADIVRAAANGGKWTWLTSRAASVMEQITNLGTRIAGGARWVAPVATGFAKAAPILSVFVAGLDIGKAALEQDPEKKVKAQGMALLSSISGLGGIVAAGGALGAVAFGVALAPLAVPAMIIAGVATVVALADQFLLGGAITKKIGQGLNAVGDGIGKAWSALTSLF